MKKTDQIAFRISEEVKERLQDAAKKDSRPLSNYMCFIIEKHLAELSKQQGQGHDAQK